jgi:NAD+ synthase
VISELAIDCGREKERIASFIADFVSRRGAKGVCLGLSGGIDSAVVASLCAKALSPDRVIALSLPERDSSPDSVEDARGLARALGISCEVRDLTKALDDLGCYRSGASAIVRLRGIARGATRLFPGTARASLLASLRGDGAREFREFVAFYRMKHRLRLVALCREAERRDCVVAACANRTEFETGFFVRYGDDSGEIAPIRHLYKMQVFHLGEHLGIPARILRKEPSPDLFAGIKDEEIIGVPYETLDGILCLMGRGLGDAEISSRVGAAGETIRYVKELRDVSQRFREPPATLP